MKEYHRKLFLTLCWRTIFGFYITYLCLLIMIQLARIDLKNKICYDWLATSVAIILLLITDILIRAKTEITEHALMILILIKGFYLSLEGTQYLEYRFHEPWLCFYPTYLLLSISCCFYWKRMIFIFWFIQTFNFMILHIVYGKLNFYFYSGYAFITILMPFVCMVISRIILMLLLLIHNNQELVKVIYKMLQIFPEGFLVQQQDSQTQSLVVQFVNDTAAKEILDYESPCGRPIDDDKLNYCVRKANNLNDINQINVQHERKSTLALSRLLQSHIDQINKQIDFPSDSIHIYDEKEIEDSLSLNNTKCYTLKTVQICFWSKKKYFIHIFINCSDKKCLEQEKIKNECLRKMFTGVSNEFRTPLNSFTNSFFLLETNYSTLLKNINDCLTIELQEKIISNKLKESNEHFFKICKISTSSLMSIVKDLLDLDKIEEGTFTLNDQKFTIKSLIEDIQNIFDFQCTQKGLVLRIDLDKELTCSSFYSDIDRIKQVLISIISNAYKFTPAGGISIRVKQKYLLDEFSAEQIRYLEFKIADTGIGISDMEMQSIFKMLKVCNPNRPKLNCKGAGVGLAITKMLVDALGGSIVIHSQEGLGTEVIFTVKERPCFNFLEESKVYVEPESPFLSSDIFTITGNINQINDPQCESVRIFHAQKCNLSERSKISDKF